MGMDVAAETVPPALMLALRYLVAGALLYAWVARKGVERPTVRQWGAATVIGGLLLSVGTGAVVWAVQRVDTGLVALIVGAMPLWLAVLDRAFYGTRLSAVAIAGLAVGFAGVTMLAGPDGGGWAALAPLFGSFAWAAGSLWSRKAPQPASPLLGAAMQMIGGGALLLVAGLATGELSDVQVPSTRSLAALVYLVLAGSFVGYTCYIWLLGVAPTALVATYAYVNPVVAVALGALFLGERLTGLTALAGLAVVTSVALIVSAKAPTPAARTAAMPARAK
jgi:drug/metabolite transporter (DMT)-like permease